MENNKLINLQDKLGYHYKDIDLLCQALTHSSYVNEVGRDRYSSNERLEYLGDSVLGMIIAGMLFLHTPMLSEGEMTKYRATLVCEESLSTQALRLDLGACLFLGRGEDSGGGRNRPSILADAFEALVASIYIDGGYEQAVRFVEERFKMCPDIMVSGKHDYKSLLQEFVQNKSMSHSYKLVAQDGPDHDKTFTVKVLVNGKPKGTGTGKSKKAAEQAAAREALITLEGEK